MADPSTTLREPMKTALREPMKTALREPEWFVFFVCIGSVSEVEPSFFIGNLHSRFIFSIFHSMKGYFYILQCNDNSYYSGSTNNLDLRMEEHMMGNGAEYTKKRLPVQIVYYEEYESLVDAYERERQIHGWTRRKKELLIERRFNELKGAGNKNKTNQ